MTISMFQCLLIGLWTAFCLAGMLFGIYTNRCLVMAAGVGLILGDLPTGLAMGAVGELAFMGFGVSQGGSVPPNPMGPGIVGTIIAITMKDSGIDVGSALALSFPFAVAFQFVITATYTFASPEGLLFPSLIWTYSLVILIARLVMLIRCRLKKQDRQFSHLSSMICIDVISTIGILREFVLFG